MTGDAVQNARAQSAARCPRAAFTYAALPSSKSAEGKTKGLLGRGLRVRVPPPTRCRLTPPISARTWMTRLLPLAGT